MSNIIILKSEKYESIRYEIAGESKKAFEILLKSRNQFRSGLIAIELQRDYFLHSMEKPDEMAQKMFELEKAEFTISKVL
jgi:hypothetical protein